MNHNLENAVVCILGLGCVGLDTNNETVAHEAHKQLKLSDLARMKNTNPMLVDVRGVYNGVEPSKQVSHMEHYDRRKTKGSRCNSLL